MPDLIAPNLRVLFCGINPGLYSGATGHHFARPGNRFWKALYRGGFTDRLLEPDEEVLLLSAGLGIISFVDRATARADCLSQEELRAGGMAVRSKVQAYRPQVVAFLGLQAYRTAFGAAGAQVGPQQETIGSTRLWVLPNPSGLNAHYQLDQLGALFEQVRLSVPGSGSVPPPRSCH